MAIAVALGVMPSGCGLFDSGVMWRQGPYILHWIDTLENTTLAYDLGGNTSVGRIERTVFAVGANSSYLVAKQHPLGNKAVTNYFYIDIRKDAKFAKPSEVVIGPLTHAEFIVHAKELALPEFSKTIGALQ